MDSSVLPRLNELSIYQLRVLGRQVGVALPTTLKKKALIEKIRAIMSGAELPYVRKTNKGRPPKNVPGLPYMKSLEAVESAFSGLENHYGISLPDLASYESIKPQEVADKEELILSGFVEIVKDGYGYFMTIPQTMSEPVYIKISIVAKFNLQNGDRIEAKVFQDLTSKLAIVEDVLSINGIQFNKQTEYYDYDNSKQKKKEKLIININEDEPITFLNNSPNFYLGDKAILSIEEKKSVPQIMFDFLSKLNSSTSVTDIVFVAQDINDEFATAIEDFEKVISISSKFGDSKDYQKKIFEIALIHSKRLASIKDRNVVLVIQNLSDALNLFVGDNEEVVKSFCKRYFASAKQTEFSSLTCAYGFVGDLDLQNEYETNENVFLKYLPHKYLTKTQIKVNMLESFRTQLFVQDSLLSDFESKIKEILDCGDYFTNHVRLEKCAQSSTSIDDFFNNI